MKRVLVSLVATVLGLVALLSFKSRGHPVGAAGPLPSAALPAASSPSNSSPPVTVGAPPTPGSGGTATSRTIAGTAIDTKYGVVQVQVTVTSTKISNVSFLQLTAFDGRSQEINSYAAPILLQETLAAQSANIDTVSGASYTTYGYVQSLQSALDKAGIR